MDNKQYPCIFTGAMSDKILEFLMVKESHFGEVHESEDHEMISSLSDATRKVSGQTSYIR